MMDDNIVMIINYISCAVSQGLTFIKFDSTLVAVGTDISQNL